MVGHAAADVDLPARSTVCDLLDRRRPHHDAAAPARAGASRAAADPDDGAQRHVDGGLQRAVQDPQWRVLLSAHHRRWLQPVFAGVPGLALDRDRRGPADLPPPFQEYGLPGIIRTDNGVPFATTALGRLSTLSVWWIRLGILPELIAPAPPRAERAPRAHAPHAQGGGDAAAERQARAQQVRFNRFRAEYNDERPHEALDQETPASRLSSRRRARCRGRCAPRIPRALRSPARQPQQRHPLEEAMGLRDAHARRRVRRARRSRRWPLGRILRAAQARTHGRTHPPD